MAQRQAGLLSADDYDSGSIGQAELSAGEPEQVWEQWGLEVVPVLMDGIDTSRRLIRYNGDFVAGVSEDYKLLPNERVVQVANEVAQDLGAQPFHEFDGDWFIQLDDHVYQDLARHRVHALYSWEQGEIGGDDMEYGFALHNSIDGSLAFSCALFTFRHACQNLVHIGTGNYFDRMAQNVEEEREVLQKVTKKHTDHLEVEHESLKALVKANLTLVDDIDATYKTWVDDRLTARDVLDLIDRLPQKDLPEWVQNEVLDALEAERERQDLETLPAFKRREIIEEVMPGTQTVWDTYNDVTQGIWHDERTSDDSKRRKMKQTHRVFDPLTVQAD